MQSLYEGLSSLDLKVFYYSMQWPCSFVKEGLPFTPDLFLKNSVDCYYVFDWLYLTQCFTSFFYQSTSCSPCKVFDCISSNIDDVLSINPFYNLFVFGDFTVYYKDWLTYSGGTYSVIISLFQMILLR